MHRIIEVCTLRPKNIQNTYSGYVYVCLLHGLIVLPLVSQRWVSLFAHLKRKQANSERRSFCRRFGRTAAMSDAENPKTNQVRQKINLHPRDPVVPPQKVLGPSKPTPNTFSEGTWILRDIVIVTKVSAEQWKEHSSGTRGLCKLLGACELENSPGASFHFVNPTLFQWCHGNTARTLHVGVVHSAPFINHPGLPFLRSMAPVMAPLPMTKLWNDPGSSVRDRT